MASRISASEGLGLLASKYLADIRKPAVQNPHCSEWFSWKHSCNGLRWPSTARLSIVSTSLPCARMASRLHALTVRPSRMTVHAPHLPSLHPRFEPVRLALSRMKSSSSVRGSMSAVYCLPFILVEIRAIGSPNSPPAVRAATPSAGYVQLKCGPVLFCTRRSRRSRRLRVQLRRKPYLRPAESAPQLPVCHRAHVGRSRPAEDWTEPSQ